jgi:hypothetical protein
LSLNPDKEEVRAYLLGTLDSALKTDFEEKILYAPEVYEELLIVEEELIDRYVASGLSQLERQQFETHFLITAERQNNLRFGQLLKRYLNSHSIADPAAAATSHVEKSAPAPKPFMFSPALVSSRPLITFCITGVVLLGVALLGWLTVRKPTARSSTQQKAEPVVVVSLAPGSITTGGQTARQVNVPPKGYNLKLELELKNASFRNYKFELFRENKPVQSSAALPVEAKGQQYVIPLTITGEVLSPGDYQVKLSGVLESGADEFIQNYFFQVIE